MEGPAAAISSCVRVFQASDLTGAARGRAVTSEDTKPLDDSSSRVSAKMLAPAVEKAARRASGLAATLVTPLQAAVQLP